MLLLSHCNALGNRRTKGRPKKITMEKPREEVFSALSSREAILSGREAEIVLDGQEMLDAGVLVEGGGGQEAGVGQEVDQERIGLQERQEVIDEVVQERQEVVQEEQEVTQERQEVAQEGQEVVQEGQEGAQEG